MAQTRGAQMGSMSSALVQIGRTSPFTQRQTQAASAIWLRQALAITPTAKDAKRISVAFRFTAALSGV